MNQGYLLLELDQPGGTRKQQKPRPHPMAYFQLRKSHELIRVNVVFLPQTIRPTTFGAAVRPALLGLGSPPSPGFRQLRRDTPILERDLEWRYVVTRRA